MYTVRLRIHWCNQESLLIEPNQLSLRVHKGIKCLCTSQENLIQREKVKLPSWSHKPEREERHRYTIQQFYGTKEGSRNYQDERFKNGFKCYHCTKTINNNIKFMQHIKNHLEKEKQENLSLSDIINCEHCGRRFNTPFELQCHIEKAHLNTSNLKCKICDMVYESRLNLQCHLNTKHPPLQMPYHCPVCNFRSSVHDDIIEHFRCKHEGIRQLLCTHCLKGVRDGTSYLRHCQKHQTKSGNSRCKQCKLMFLTPAELKTHMKEDHIRFPVKKVSESVKSQEQIIQESAEQKRVLKRASVDSFDIYKKQKKQMRGDARKGTLESYSLLDWKASLDKTRKIDDNGMVHKCSECSTAIDDLAAHFATFLKCSSCPYRTYCGMSYGNHMIKFHKSNRPAPKLHPVTKPSIDILKCEKCNYCTESGSAMAGHVMTCTMGPTEVEGFKHHTRPRRPEEYAQSSCSSNSPGTKWMESPEPSQYQDDGFFDDVVKDDASVTDAVSNIIDRLFGTDDEPPSQNPVDDANIMAEPSIPSTSAQETKVNDDDDDDIILLDDDEPEIEKTSKPEKKTIPAEPATVLEEESPVVEDDKEGAAEDALLESHPAEEEGGLEDNSLSKEEEDKLLEDEEDELVTEDAKADVGDTLTDGTDGVAVAEHCQDEQVSPDKPTKEDFGSSENKSDGAGSEEDAKDVHAVGSGDPLESKDEDVVMATNDPGDSESVDLLGNHPSVEDNTMEVDA
uniref:Zinc finger protein 280D-like n=1 Tax=Saccoglossus kowalevskii TaxID=10224 RepID=A0ABM0LVX1_SACKO|nr:PREDICTED: zinc finger protein 280D-like [Saccoglossus kowalevskii]